jgi:hypothetical protein
MNLLHVQSFLELEAADDQNIYVEQVGSDDAIKQYVPLVESP